MTDEKCELLTYIDDSLEKYYNKTALLKESENSRVELYTHKNTDSKLIKRVMPNRNDGVYRALRRNPCSNTPHIYDVCVQDNSTLIVLEEYIEGDTLYDILKTAELSQIQCCKIIIGLCNTLSELHSMGVVHRDIKPSNVILNRSRTAVWLIDFSIARLISAESDNDTEAFGTVGYAPPEQYGILQSQNTNDLYALGVMFNIMLTGLHPTVEMPTKTKLRKIVEKATDIQITKRFQSADEFKKAVTKAMYSI